jgi:putative ABC transport system ATP-binding protein
MNHSMNEPLIRTRNLERRYAAGSGHTHVLRQVSLDVEAGEFVTIMGPSGAGKTTLLSILGMLDHEWSGEYWLAGEPVHAVKLKKRMELGRRHIGFVFQQYHLLDDLTVAENLDVPLSYRDVPRSERQALVADSLDRFGMVGKKDLFPSQLSGGQQQLVGVARAVIAAPKLILADEPTGSLHSRQGREIMELFRELNSDGTTIIQVTHNEDWAAYGSRVIELEDGWVLADTAAAAAGAAAAGSPHAGPRPGAGPATGVMGLLLAGAVALGSVIGTTRADAQSLAPSDTLRLEDAVETALHGSPELRQAEARARSAGAGRLDAWGRLLPTVTFYSDFVGQEAINRTGMNPITGAPVLLPEDEVTAQELYQTRGGVNLGWTVIDGGQLWQVRRARRESAAGYASLEGARARVAAGVTLAYLNVLEAEAQSRVRAAEVERANALVEDAQVRFDVGQSAEIDVLQARLAASDAELALDGALAAAEAARLALVEYLEPGANPTVALAPPPAPRLVDRLSEDELRQCALQGSADLAALRARADAARMESSAWGWTILPTVRLGVGWGRSELGGTTEALRFDPRNETTTYTMTINWNPLSQPGQWVASRQRARAAEVEAEATLAARRPALVREVEVALSQIRRAQMLEERSVLNLELAERQREQAAERYRLGVAPIAETIQAEALAREAERQAVTAEFARRRALAELEYAAAVRLDDPRSPCGAVAGDR